MGVDVRIKLPGDVRVRDVAEVIGILCGMTAEWQSSGGARWVVVPGVGVESIPSLPECNYINFEYKGQAHQWMFHYESEGSGRLMIPRSTALNIAIGRGLVEFFGGEVDYRDCDSRDCDYKKRKRFKNNSPSDGKEWDRFQQAMFVIQPLTDDEVTICSKFAAYH